MPRSFLDCRAHGARPATVVCAHILAAKDQIVGFIENGAEPQDLQAWCRACEARFQQEGGLTPAFEKFNNRAIVCDLCYRGFKAQQTVAR